MRWKRCAFLGFLALSAALLLPLVEPVFGGFNDNGFIDPPVTGGGGADSLIGLNDVTAKAGSGSTVVMSTAPTLAGVTVTGTAAFDSIYGSGNTDIDGTFNCDSTGVFDDSTHVDDDFTCDNAGIGEAADGDELSVAGTTDLDSLFTSGNAKVTGHFATNGNAVDAVYDLRCTNGQFGSIRVTNYRLTNADGLYFIATSRGFIKSDGGYGWIINAGPYAPVTLEMNDVGGTDHETVIDTLGCYSESFAPSVCDTVASATNLVLGQYNRFVVTGTTQIDSIDTGSAMRNWSQCTIETTGNCQFTDGKNLILSGNWAGTADDILVLERRGNNFVQVGGSHN